MSLTLMLPIFADQKWLLKEVPEDWNGMSSRERLDYFLTHAEPQGYLCHHCSKTHQVGELADEEIEDNVETYFDDDTPGGIQP